MSTKYHSTTASVATTVTVTDNESTNEGNAVVFVADADLDGGDVALEADGDFIYNPSTGAITAPALTLPAGANRTISVATDNTEGDQLTVVAASGGTGDVNGGALNLTGGAGGSGGNNTGGAVVIAGGVDAGTDAGGAVSIRGGAGDTNGDVNLGDSNTATVNVGTTLALGANSITMSGSIGVTGTRVTKGWFTDLECTNSIAADITGDSATCSGQAATVATIAGLAPDTATTQATQASITTCANLTTVGALAVGSLAAGFGDCNVGTIDCGGAFHYDAIVAIGNVGATETVNWSSKNIQSATLDQNCAFTFTSPGGPASLTLVATNFGAFTPTWPGTVKWPNGAEPTWTAAGVDLICFVFDGTSYHGNVGSVNSS